MWDYSGVVEDKEDKNRAKDQVVVAEKDEIAVGL